MVMKRYLRVTRHCVLEVKIYVTNSKTASWPSEQLLQEALQLARVLIIPKLREENQLKKKKRPTRDTIHGSSFNASVFLQELHSRHCVLSVQKQLSFGKTAEVVESSPFHDSSPLFIASDDEEEQKDKATLSAKYRGFQVHGKSLCLILQPLCTDAELAQQETLLENWMNSTQHSMLPYSHS